jgi:hypothetical protein
MKALLKRNRLQVTGSYDGVVRVWQACDTQRVQPIALNAQVKPLVPAIFSTYQLLELLVPAISMS